MRRSLGSEIRQTKAAAGETCRRMLQAALFLVTTIALAGTAQGQTAAKCPGGHKLTLNQVVELLQNKIAGGIVVSRVQACHVSFSLDAPSLDKLVTAGASDKLLDVLNRETAGQLTVEQAHAEVAGLEARIAELNKATVMAQDLPRAADLFTRSCDGDSADGCAHLGGMYSNGHGVPRDRAKALQLFKKACSLGSEDGCKALATLQSRAAQ
jgi:hypothetical protein